MRDGVRMQGVAAGVIVSIGALTLACSEPSRSPAYEYQLTLFADSADHYVLCPAGAMYCMAAFPDSGRDSLRLQIRPPASAVATRATDSLFGMATLSTDGSITADVHVPGTCNYFRLDGTDVNGIVWGHWREQLDCHGLSRSGHFTGHR